MSARLTGAAGQMGKSKIPNSRLAALLLIAGVFGSPGFADSCGNFPGIGSREAYRRSGIPHNQAVESAKKGDYQRAVKLYRQAISIYPHDSAAYQSLGDALRETGKLEDSVIAEKKAIDLEPNYLGAWLGLGMTYELLRKFSDAEKCYRKAVEIKPDAYDCVADLGDILRQQGKFKEARVWLLRAKSLPGKKTPGFIENALRLCDEHKLEASN